MLETSVNLLNQAVCKLPPNLKETCSMHTVRHNWQRPTLLVFNNWLKEKAEGHERLRVINSKTKIVEPVKPKTTKVTAANSKEPSKAQDNFGFSPRIFCVKVVMRCGTVLFSKKKMLLSEQNT